LELLTLPGGIVFLAEKWRLADYCVMCISFMTKKVAGRAVCFFFTGSLPNALSLILSMEQTLLTRGSVQPAARTASD
jgi:hypothetical protein